MDPVLVSPFIVVDASLYMGTAKKPGEPGLVSFGKFINLQSIYSSPFGVFYDSRGLLHFYRGAKWIITTREASENWFVCHFEKPNSSLLSSLCSGLAFLTNMSRVHKLKL
jgi:hypothetical protein